MISEIPERLLDGLAALPLLTLGLATVAFLALETTVFIGVVVPGDVVVMLGGSTVDGPVRFALVVAATTGGSLLGESLGYLMGRLAGHRLRYGRLGRRLGERHWARAENFLHGKPGARSMVPIRFVAVVHALVPIVAGTVRMPFWRFLCWCAIASTLWGVAYTSLGMVAGASYRELNEQLGLGIWIVGALIGGVLLVIRLVRRRIAARRGDRALVPPERHGHAAPAPSTLLPAHPVASTPVPGAGAPSGPTMPVPVASTCPPMYTDLTGEGNSL